MTAFIGYLFEDTSELTYNIRLVTDEIQKKYMFVPQRFLHITLVYLGKNNTGENVNKELLKVNLDELRKINTTKCIFSCLKFIGNSLLFVFDLEDINVQKSVTDIMVNYNNNVQLHVTMGKFDGNCTKIFEYEFKEKIEKMLENTKFIIGALELIDVNLFKIYSVRKEI
jgi:hypothetical protein